MPEEPLVAALGHLVIAWSTIEAVIEVAIAKQLGLGSLDGSVVTASILFQGRAKMLLSLLHRDEEKNNAAIRTVKAMQGLTDRNDILHSVIGASKQEIWFNRRKTDVRYTSKIERYNRERLLRAAARYTELATQLMAALEISREDFLWFLHNSHNAANRE